MGNLNKVKTWDCGFSYYQMVNVKHKVNNYQISKCNFIDDTKNTGPKPNI